MCSVAEIARSPFGYLQAPDFRWHAAPGLFRGRDLIPGRPRFFSRVRCYYPDFYVRLSFRQLPPAI
jgi:hypothetical protein